MDRYRSIFGKKRNFESIYFENLMNLLNNSVTSLVFELEQCFLHINRVELDQDYNGDEITP